MPGTVLSPASYTLVGVPDCLYSCSSSWSVRSPSEGCAARALTMIRSGSFSPLSAPSSSSSACAAPSAAMVGSIVAWTTRDASSRAFCSGSSVSPVSKAYAGSSGGKLKSYKAPREYEGRSNYRRDVLTTGNNGRPASLRFCTF